MPIETIRRSYRPCFINVLLIGESAPAAGTFFYLGDSLARYTCKALSNAYNINFENIQEFLNRFKINDYYLDDLCLIPTNEMDRTVRTETRHRYVNSLSSRLRLYSPNAIICIMMSITQYVINAINNANLENRPFYSIPFGAQGNQQRYISELTNSLLELKSNGIIGDQLL